MEFEEMLKYYQSYLVEINNVQNMRAVFDAAMRLKAAYVARDSSLSSSACVAETLQVWHETKRAVSELEGGL